jgi:hypothetical protein
MYEKLEKRPPRPIRHRPLRLLAHHLFLNSEGLGVLSHVIVVNVEPHMHPQFSLSRVCEVASQSGSRLQANCPSAEWYLS